MPKSNEPQTSDEGQVEPRLLNGFPVLHTVETATHFSVIRLLYLTSKSSETSVNDMWLTVLKAGFTSRPEYSNKLVTDRNSVFTSSF